MTTTTGNAAGDSLSAIDSQIASVLAIQIDTGVAPGLAADVGTLQAVLGQWSQSTRGHVMTALQSVLQANESLLASWLKVNQTDQQAMLAFATTAMGSANAANRSVAALDMPLAALRTAIDGSVAALKGDAQQIPQEVAEQQSREQQIEDQEQQAEERKNYYATHPFQAIGAAFSNLDETIESEIQDRQEINYDIQQLQQIGQQIARLNGAEGPLANLSAAVVGLATQVTDLQGTNQQIDATLSAVVQNQIIPILVVEQLGTVIQQLQSANQSITSILGSN